MITEVLIKALEEQQDRRAQRKADKTHFSEARNKQDFPRTRTFYYLRNEPNFGTWHKDLVRKDKCNNIYLSSNQSPSGNQIVAAYEDVMLASQCSQLKDTESISVKFPRPSYILLDQLHLKKTKKMQAEGSMGPKKLLNTNCYKD